MTLVTLTRLVPSRYRPFAAEVITFGAVGVINTVVGQVIFDALLGLGAIEAATISTAIATCVSFVLNRHVTYRHRARTPLRRELPLFAGFNLIGLGLQLGVLQLCRWAFALDHTDRLGLNLARLGGVAVGTVFLLLTYRTFVFRRRTAPAVVDADLTEPDFVLLDVELDGAVATGEPAVTGVP